MKITIDRDALIAAAAPICSVASGRNTIPSLDCILLQTQPDGTCLLVGYDLEKGIKTYLPCHIEEEGFFLLNATRFFQIIRTMPSGDVCIEINAKNCRTRIVGGSSVFELQAHPGSDYPNLPEITSDRGFTMDQGELAKILGKTAFAAAVNDPRPSLNGVFVKVEGSSITAVGCDGSRMSLCEETSDLVSLRNDGEPLSFQFIIPVKTAEEVIRLLGSDESVTLRLGRKHILFEIGTFTVFARLVDVEYIQYERFIPKTSSVFACVDRMALLMSLERAMLVTEEKQQGQSKSPVILSFRKDGLEVSSTSVTGCVNDVIPISLDGEPMEIGFNCRFLCEAIKACDADMIKLSLSAPLAGMLVEPTEKEEGKRFMLLVLPVRLNQ